MYRNVNFELLGITGSQSELIEMALSYGFEGMDLDMQDFAKQAENYGLEHARRLIDSAGIPISSFRLPLQWGQWDEDDRTYKQGLERLPRLAELAAALGCRRCVTAVEPASDERPYHENFEFHRKRLTEIAEVLAPHEIRLGLEFNAVREPRQGRAFQFIHTFEAACQLAKMAASPNVGVVADLWQIHCGGGSQQEIGEISGDQIVAVFLSDILPEVDLEQAKESDRLLPGEGGAIDSSSALRLLEQLGYEGPVALRVPRKNLPAKNREAKIRLTGERLQQLWEEAGLVPESAETAAAEQ